MANFNLNFEQYIISEFINGIIEKYVSFLNRNKIDLNDKSNEYVAALDEIYNIKDNTYKATTEEDIKKIRERVTDLNDKLNKADFNLGLELCNLNIFIGSAETQYINFLRKNRIDWSDKNNEYVAALDEIYDIKRNTYKATTEEDIQKIKARVTELKDKLLPDGKLDYFNTLEIEVMSEVAASIMAEISRYMFEKNLEDEENHPLNILEDMLLKLKHSLISTDYTMDELKLIKAKFEFARDYANEVMKLNE